MKRHNGFYIDCDADLTQILHPFKLFVQPSELKKFSSL